MKMQHKIHILHIIPTLKFGGAERFVVDLSNNLDTERFEVSILVLSDDTPLASELHDDISVYTIQKKGKISVHLIRDIKKLLQHIQSDIVHTHLFGGDCWGRIAAHQLNIPVITNEHNIVDEGPHRTIVKKILQRYTDRYIAPSEAVAVFMRDHFSITQPIDIIPHGIDVLRFAQVAHDAESVLTRFLILGRLTEQKGQDIALHAFAQIDADDWRLSIVGDGPLHDRYVTLIDELDLTDKVELLPPAIDTPHIFAQHDVVLMPSRWEALGIVGKEAMAAHKKVIASRTGGIPEYITDGVTGVLVDNFTEVRAWQHAITACLSNPKDIESMGKNAQRYAQQFFSIEQMTRSYEAVYEQLYLAHARIYARSTST